MSSASMIQVAGWAYDAGLRNPVKLAQATAIATAESGRDPSKLGDVALETATWGPSVGLWQVRSLKAEKGKGTSRDQDKLTDPTFNAKAMVEISKSGADWSPWSVTHPADLTGFARYQAAMLAAPAAVTAMLAQKGSGALVDDAQSAAGSVLDPVTQLAGVLSDAAQTPVKIFNWLTDPKSWLRIGYLVGGGALILLGVGIFARPVLKKTASAVTAVVVPEAKAAGMAAKG
jgi:hypothetical protein